MVCARLLSTRLFLLSLACSTLGLLLLSSFGLSHQLSGGFDLRSLLPLVISPDMPSKKTAWFSEQLDSEIFNSRWATLGVASRVFVIHLPRRDDRLKEMEKLREALDLEWTYMDAVESASDLVEKIVHQVKKQRALARSSESEGLVTGFWPDNIDTLSSSVEPLGLAGSDLWSMPLSDKSDRQKLGSLNTRKRKADPSSSSLTCATADDTLPKYSSKLPDFKLLTPAKIACWHSHLTVLRAIVEMNETAVVLEDDVDMDKDIHRKLRALWHALPERWDAVFLGHCWSNESHLPALPHPYRDGIFPQSWRTASIISRQDNNSIPTLHPSFAPKCTHAYALSPHGARRLLLHLRHPPFAYSRAIDQAYSWLIKSNRIQAFSVVPSIVVQRKIGESDVMGGNGSEWRDTFPNGVLQTSM